MPCHLSPADLAHLGGTVGEVYPAGVTVTPETVEQVAEALVDGRADLDALVAQLDEREMARYARALIGATRRHERLVRVAWESAIEAAETDHRRELAVALCRLLAERR